MITPADNLTRDEFFRRLAQGAAVQPGLLGEALLRAACARDMTLPQLVNWLAGRPMAGEQRHRLLVNRVPSDAAGARELAERFGLDSDRLIEAITTTL